MKVTELDDYSADIRFGEWLRSQRVRKGLELEAAAKCAGLSADRLKGLEMGLSNRGVTRSEAAKICDAYGIDLSELIDRASKS